MVEPAGEMIPDAPEEFPVMIQPPEGRRGDGEEADTLFSETIQFPPGGGVVGRRSPVLAVLFQEWKDMMVGQSAAKLLVINKNKGN